MGQCAPGKQVADGAKEDDPAKKEEEEGEESGILPGLIVGDDDEEGGKKKKKKKKKLSKAQQEVDAVLGHLQVPKGAVTKFLTFFKKMDDDNSGNISLEEFIDFLELDKYYVPFIERCFGAMDFNKKGKSAGALDPTEFTVGLYNLCIMSKDLLEDYVFELYDEVHDGNLYQRQVEKMVEESSDHDSETVKALVEQVYKALDKDGDGHISKAEFFHLDSKTESLLRPMYLMQTNLQKRCLGENFWDEERGRMRDMLEEYSVRTIIDLLANRVAAKYEADRLKRGEAIVKDREEEKQKAAREKVKGFGSEKNMAGAKKGLTFASDGGAPVFASEIEAKKKERAALAKAKKKAKKKKEAAAKGEAPEKHKNKNKTHVSVSVRGAQKKGGGGGYALKHKEELAVNNKK
ncbi:hypothetical protein TrVE_jg8773 [Triparma verrucosa]|uniref:EF-hand domain-containing protein n=1 Tax=Triparma verrucosa TaxID=1606542 RepID=A0A9W7DNN8_9STRA|nr:hypothetical protein TrVE_jg8773 [Triparma verrucosa]